MLCVHPRALPVIYWKLVLLAVSEIEFGALENQIVYLFQSFVGFFSLFQTPKQQPLPWALPQCTDSSGSSVYHALKIQINVSVKHAVSGKI